MAATSAPGDGAAGEPILETDGLVRRFGELVAIDDVSLEVPSGEFRSVIGPNGAGKTTLFDLICGVLRPSSGHITFRGRDVGGLPPHERVRLGIGRSFQITNVFTGLTVRENVRLAAQALAEGERSPVDWWFHPKARLTDVAERAETTVERVGLDRVADERAGTLAYGDRRRLEIAIVLATDPELVLLDEPTAGMSREETRETMALIRSVLADRTVLLIEHDVDLVMDFSDRITVLDRGRVLAEGPPEDIAADEDVRAAYLGGER